MVFIGLVTLGYESYHALQIWQVYTSAQNLSGAKKFIY